MLREQNFAYIFRHLASRVPSEQITFAKEHFHHPGSLMTLEVYKKNEDFYKH